MKKKLMVLFSVLLLVFAVGCAQPPEDVPAAKVSDLEPDVEEADDSEVEIEDDSDSEVEEVEDGSESEEAEEEAEPETLPIDTTSSVFEFEGYGPGKSHVGTFDEMSGTLTFEGSKIVAAEVTIQADSVNTGIGGLDAHLKRDDFFDVEKFPEIEFVSESIEYDSSGEGTMVGTLTFHGVTKSINIPISAEGTKMSTDFLLDTTPFGMTNAGVNKEVRIAFTVGP